MAIYGRCCPPSKAPSVARWCKRGLVSHFKYSDFFYKIIFLYFYNYKKIYLNLFILMSLFYQKIKNNFNIKIIITDDVDGVTNDCCR